MPAVVLLLFMPSSFGALLFAGTIFGHVTPLTVVSVAMFVALAAVLAVGTMKTPHPE